MDMIRYIFGRVQDREDFKVSLVYTAIPSDT